MNTPLDDERLRRHLAGRTSGRLKYRSELCLRCHGIGGVYCAITLRASYGRVPNHELCEPLCFECAKAEYVAAVLST